MPTLLAAPDKFRGSLGAREAAAAIALGARDAGWEAVELPLADGGEGTLEALGGANRHTVVTGPLGEPVEAGWRFDGDDAIVEMALASGLTLSGGRDRNDPIAATTRGTGELIAAALAAGARSVVVGIGGSATTDGGEGALEALADWLPFPAHGARVQVACDVTTLFVDAARVFAPQKGASPGQVRELERRLERLAVVYQDRFGVDVGALPGSGAAGGLAGGLAAAGASLRPGFELVARLVDLDEAIRGADLVVTGEGRLDRTSFEGKVVGGVAACAASADVPVFVVAGDVDSKAGARLPAVSLVARFGHQRSFADTAACLRSVVSAHLLDTAS